MSSPRIAIIGAGPGGLTLARILQQNAMECTFFELDKDRSIRDQGGIVDLHREMGQLALREAGLFDAFQKHSLPGAEAIKLVKGDGRVFWDENDWSSADTGNSGDRPEIDRAKLRDILLDSIHPDSIQWNKKLLRVEPAETPDCKYNLRFADGVESGFDLVVGADGAWSKVRSLLTGQLPFYSGVTLIELRAMEVSAKKEWLAKFTGQGSCFMFDQGRAFVCQRNGNDSIRVYAGVRQPETWVKGSGIDWDQRHLAQKIFTERCFGDCHDDIKRVIAVEASDGLIPRPLYMLPVGLKWLAWPGPLTDALDLSRALLNRKDNFAADLSGNLADALQEYEGAMFERARENMEKTWGGLQHHFSAGGIDERVRRLQGRAKLREAAKLREEAEVREKATQWEEGAFPNLSFQQRV